MSPKPDVSEERKNQILNAAAKVFARLGINKARMDDIVEESGLSKGTLYWYFDSKDEIIVSILETLFEPEFKDLELISKDEIPAIEKLQRIADLLVADLDRISRYMPLAYEFFSLAYRNKYVRKIIKTYFQKFTGVLVQILDEGVEKKELYTPDSRQTAVHLGALFEGTLLLSMYDPDSVKMAEDIHAGMGIFIDSLNIK